MLSLNLVGLVATVLAFLAVAVVAYSLLRK
jgi:hypothetical protein